MEDPALAKGLVKRDIIRVITPGTVIESSMLADDKNNYICSVYTRKVRSRWKAGICFADISTGELEATTLTAEKGETLSRAVIDALSRFTPREILINPEFTDLTDVAKFVSDKLSASLECMDFAVYEPLHAEETVKAQFHPCLLYTSPSPRDCS